MLALKATVTRYLDRDSLPAWVEAEFVDADGRRWCFQDKEPIFVDQEMHPPSEGTVRYTLQDGSWPSADGGEVITISTLAPDHVEAFGSGETTFRVRAAQLVELPGPLIAVFVPSLVSLLLARERAKGRPLTEQEVLAVRDAATVVMAPRSGVDAVRLSRGYEDIDPEDCWNAWREVRVELLD